MTDLARTNAYNSWIDETGITTGYLPARQDPTQRLRDWVDLFRDVVKAAEFLCKTPFVPKEMIGKSADVATAIMKGHELGMDPLDALANIYVIHGRVGFYAEFMRRRIIQSGHTFRVVESSDTRCIVEGTRKEGGEPQRASFSADQARKAGLNLGSYPADKLLARATSRLCRQVFPDVLSGTLIAEDIIDGLLPTDDDAPSEMPSGGQTYDTPPRPSLQRARKPRTPKAAATQPPTAEVKGDRFHGTDDDLLEDERTHKYTLKHGPEIDLLDEQADEQPTPRREAAGTTGDDMEDAVAVVTTILTADDTLPLDKPEPISPGQLKKLSILLREAGFDTQEARHAFVATAINRQIDSAKNLTKNEASHVIDTLENQQD